MEASYALAELIDMKRHEPERYDRIIRLALGPADAKARGKRFGLLVHRVLAEVPLQSTRAAVEQAAWLHGRVLGSNEEETRTAIEVMSRALPIRCYAPLRRAPRSGVRHRCSCVGAMANSSRPWSTWVGRTTTGGPQRRRAAASVNARARRGQADGCLPRSRPTGT